MHKSRVPPSACRKCSTPLDAATSPYGYKISPKPGDISICLVCYTISLFDEDLQLREPTAAEMTVIRADPRLAPIVRTKTQ